MANKPEHIVGRIPMIANLGARNAESLPTKLLPRDDLIRNGYVVTNNVQETGARHAYVYKRPGILGYNHSVAVTGASGGRGVYFSPSLGFGVFVRSGTFYKFDGTIISTDITGTAKCGFCDVIDSGVAKIFVCNGTRGWLYDGTTFAEITDADFPKDHVTTPIFMNGYLFLVDRSKNRIYNSNIQKPSDWDPTNFISPEMYPDSLVGLSRQKNYIVAIGSNTTEFFYDAGNSVGSPLRRTDSAILRYGTLHSQTIVEGENAVIYLNISDAGGANVVGIENFAAQELSNTTINNLLTQNLYQGLTQASATLLRISGKLFYVLSMRNPQSTVGPYSTAVHQYVYDIHEKLWYIWDGIDVYTATSVQQSVGYSVIVQSQSSGLIADISTTNVIDREDKSPAGVDTPIELSIVLPDFDGDSTFRKFFHRASLVTSIDTGLPADSNNTVSLSWSDNDGNTWSTPRTIPYNNRLTWSNLGQTRHRMFKMTTKVKARFRVSVLEVEYTLGDN